MSRKALLDARASRKSESSPWDLSQTTFESLDAYIYYLKGFPPLSEAARQCDRSGDAAIFELTPIGDIIPVLPNDLESDERKVEAKLLGRRYLTHPAFQRATGIPERSPEKGVG